MNIVLIGYRGTGKTVVGQRLAKVLDRPFFDADILIEENGGMTIADMVDTKGWTFFRKLEKEIIRELSERTASVIATGGGAVMDPENVAHLGERGTFVLLTADIDVLAQRIQADQTSARTRPPLVEGTVREELQTMLTERMPTYKELARLTVDTSDRSIDEVVTRIVRQMGLQTDKRFRV